MNTKSRRNIARLCATSLLLASALSPARAAMLPPTAGISSAVEQSMTTDRAREQVNAFVARDEVRSQFLSMGIAPEHVDARIAALSDDEVRTLSEKIGTAPAGGNGVLGALGVIFVVMLVLELLGITNFFTSIGPAR